MSHSTQKRVRTHKTPPNVSPKRSLAEKCPPEIWAAICEACMDGGPTGRSLSLVSRNINEASKRYKYLSLALTRRQFRPLALTLRNLPSDARLVRHLYVESYVANDGFFNVDLNRLLILVAPTLDTGDQSFRSHIHFAISTAQPG